MDPLLAKERRLHRILRDCGSAVIAYSGGVDSAYLAGAAVHSLGRDRVLAVIGRSPSYPERQYRMAVRVAEMIDLPLLEITTREIADPRYVANAGDRCYYCKSELYDRLREVARERGLRTLIDGANADDVRDHRPGATAARERDVRSPLREAALSKHEIRELSRRADLPTWDLAASPCLASRIAYGTRVTPDRLRRVERAESHLHDLRSWSALRVRHHGAWARLEVGATDLERVCIDRRLQQAVGRALDAAGFSRGCLDLEGYRRGALNEALVPLRRASRVDAPAAGRGSPRRSACEAVEAELLRLGLPAAVSTAGGDDEIAVVRPQPGTRLERWSVELRAATVTAARASGFRYAAVALCVDVAADRGGAVGDATGGGPGRGAGISEFEPIGG